MLKSSKNKILETIKFLTLAFLLLASANIGVSQTNAPGIDQTSSVQVVTIIMQISTIQGPDLDNIRGYPGAMLVYSYEWGGLLMLSNLQTELSEFFITKGIDMGSPQILDKFINQVLLQRIDIFVVYDRIGSLIEFEIYNAVITSFYQYSSVDSNGNFISSETISIYWDKIVHRVFEVTNGQKGNFEEYTIQRPGSA